MNQPTVSVVIPAFNCEQTILKTLQGVLQQTYPNVKIIVVDDGSTDQTSKIVQSIDRVQYVYQKNKGPASARNRGAGEVRTDIMFFTDSDCIPEEDWIAKAIVHFENPEIAVVSGSYGIANPESLLARCIHKEIKFRHHRLMPQYPQAFGSYNFGIRKNVFIEVGGFDTNYKQASGEDNDLSYKIIKAGYKIYFEKNSLVKHKHSTCLRQYLHEQFRHGYWRVKMYADHPNMVAGDDYTFWKDIIEVPIALTICISSVFMIFNFVFFFILTVRLIGVLFLLEFVYGLVVTKNIFEAIFFSFVMFFRAFVRMTGFSSGILSFLTQKTT